MFNKFFATLAIIAVSSHVAEGIKWRQAYQNASNSLEDGEVWNNRQAFRAGMAYDDGKTKAWRKAMNKVQNGMEEGDEWTDKQAFRAGLRFARHRANND